MNDTMSLILATSILAVGGLGLYMYIFFTTVTLINLRNFLVSIW